MTQYFLSYNQAKFQYVVWNNQQVICRVSDVDRKDENWKKVVEFFQEEYKKTKQPLEIYAMSTTSQTLETIMKIIEGIRKK